VYIALDCDKAGQDATTKIHEQLPEAVIINLNLSDGGDLADFCKLYTTDSFAELQRRVGVKTPPPKPADDTISESFQTLAVASRDEFVGLQSGKVKRLGLQSKIPDLDAVVGTFMPARIHLILGATGMGKSTLGVSLALAFMWQAPGLVVSTETPPRLWIAKCAAMKANVPVDRILEGTATNTEATAIQDAYHSLYKKPVRVLKTVSPDIGDIEDWVKRWVKPLGAKWLLIDSISRVIAKGKHNIFDKTTEVSNRLQSLTLETGLSVVTTSQVGRHLRDRANKIPTIQDGYGSGALEQDADVVMALYYHDYYVRQGLVDANTLYPPGKALLQVGKHRWRNVDNQQVFMHFRGGIGFYPWEKERAVIAPPLPLAVANDIDMWS
jgi:replicative DNA helicase